MTITGLSMASTPPAVEAPERDRPVSDHLRIELDVSLGRRGRGHVLDGELHRRELVRPGALELLDGVEYELVELVARAAGDGNADGRDRTAQPTTMPVPSTPLAPYGGHARARRLVALHES